MITHQFNWPTEVVWAVLDALNTQLKTAPIKVNEIDRIKSAIVDLEAADGEYQHQRELETAYGHNGGW